MPQLSFNLSFPCDLLASRGRVASLVPNGKGTCQGFCGWYPRFRVLGFSVASSLCQASLAPCTAKLRSLFSVTVAIAFGGGFGPHGKKANDRSWRARQTVSDLGGASSCWTQGVRARKKNPPGLSSDCPNWPHAPPPPPPPAPKAFAWRAKAYLPPPPKKKAGMRDRKA